ncbi:ABC transporter substrate-binding protein [Rugamonas sp. DEMB1]|uniref:ABC transporter substrate-binding protein n=1 Tax=Rugamonas sp. DEMB1 TaxID=3039386 RepID=UPI002448BEC2|nr:ABC transporter substrate-binding protein [Rugamonas sp. DEMB1]WGG49180.1 ABC transporter substrate-binding protein [Rugamonas sp. DEMB1]
MKSRISAAMASAVAFCAVATPQVGAAPATITVASFPDLDRAVKVALPMWEKLHPEIKIKLVSLQIEDHHNSMTTALAAGAHLPDVVAVDFGYIGIFAESKGLDEPAGAAICCRAVPQAVRLLHLPAGHQLARQPGGDAGRHRPGHAVLPQGHLMDKAGIKEEELSRSWESYIESGKKLKAATGTMLLARAGDLKDIYIRANLKDGEGIYFGDKGKVLVDSPRFVRAFELAKAARVAGIDTKTVAWTSEWSEGFKRGKVASQMSGFWFGGHLAKWLAPDYKGQWRASGLPGGALASYGGSFYAIPKKAVNKAEAWEFIKFMTANKEVQLTALREISGYPSLLAAHGDPAMDEAQPYFGGQKTRQLARDTAVKIPVIRVDKYDWMANEVVNSELENVLEQNKDIKTALRDAKALIERRARR